MGLGDDIMATAQARVVHEATGHKVSFGYWSEVFENNPRIAKEGPAVQLNNRPGHRPYILGQTDRRFIFNPNYRAVPGEIWLTAEEHEWARDVTANLDDSGVFILVEPHVKEKVSGRNKDWGWDKWQDLVNRLDREIIQLDYGKPILDGVTPIKAPDFRHACAILVRARHFIGTDGGLHHAAAAWCMAEDGTVHDEWSRRARADFVIWGHYSAPHNLGYPQQNNIVATAKGPCGSLDPCEECRAAMEKLSVDRVMKVLRRAGDPTLEGVYDHKDMTPYISDVTPERLRKPA